MSNRIVRLSQHAPATPVFETLTGLNAAQAAGFTSLVFCDDFDDPATIDFSATGKAGCHWYLDNPYGMEPFKPSDLTVKNSVLTFAPEKCHCGLFSYSKKGDTGFSWHYGYAEAKIRLKASYIVSHANGRKGWPSFWGISLNDVRGKPWEPAGEIDIMEAFMVNDADNEGGAYYCGAVHDHHRLPEGGKEVATNTCNAIGHHGDSRLFDDDWHTYGVLWKENYLAWYIDGRFHHAVEYGQNQLPVYRVWNSDTPLEVAEGPRNRVGAFSILDTDRLTLVIGGDIRWPCEVDWVRVWGTP